MSRFLIVAFLWLASVASALGVVYESHLARRATANLENSRRELNALQVESGQLSLEKSSMAAYARVESVAGEQLHMVNPSNVRFIALPKDAL
jgi:cell division protein FtsL